MRCYNWLCGAHTELNRCVWVIAGDTCHKRKAFNRLVSAAERQIEQDPVKHWYHDLIYQWDKEKEGAKKR